MKDAMKKILSSQDLCVLATMSTEGPHSSLMAYICDDTCREMYMVTHSDTRKYINIKQFPAVSLLVDTRVLNGVTPRSDIQAITVSGQVSVIDELEERAGVKEKLVDRHKHLVSFAGDEKAVFFKVTIQSLQLLSGVTNPVYLSFDAEAKDDPK